MIPKFKNKKAQVTIFIIIAIVVVFSVALFFFIKSGLISRITGGGETTNPQTFMQGCLEDKMMQNIDLVTLQGGFIEPKLYKVHEDVPATYLCYNRGYFDNCIMQHPMLLNEIEEELEEAITSNVEDCYIELEDNFQKSGGEMILGQSTDINVEILYGYVDLNLIRDISATEKDQTIEINQMNIRYPSGLYEFADIAMEIAYTESKYCDFSNSGFMNLFTDYLVLKAKMSDQTEIYTIIKKDTQEKMKIAIRGCALA